ncbi:uncharacterized protein [Heterodontus francisci]|uniref:uncharacterized protein n=1 Tax=Heterodontus francisci TaxID=7792 RepID=UPI00355AE0AC
MDWPRLRFLSYQSAGYIVYLDAIVQKFCSYGIMTMPVEKTKSRVKRQLPFIGFTNFQGKREKTDQESLLQIDQSITWENIKHFKTKLKQVDVLPTVEEIQETANVHKRESVQEPEPVKRISNSKKVHIAFLPDKYEPLVEYLGESLNDNSKADKKYERKQKLKKCRKNFFKVLRTGWKYFVLGIQEFANNYTAPYGTTFTVITEMR